MDALVIVMLVIVVLSLLTFLFNSRSRKRILFDRLLAKEKELRYVDKKIAGAVYNSTYNNLLAYRKKIINDISETKDLIERT